MNHKSTTDQQHNNTLRSDCPINFFLELLGDKWSLLIIRDMLFAGKQTFGEFLNSDEKIARNILTSRLLLLEKCGLISKKPHPTDGRKDLYALTARGRELVSVLKQIAHWSALIEPRVRDVYNERSQHENV